MFLPRHDLDHTIITCQGTNVSGHKHVWAQSCLGTNVCGHNRVWAQSCLGTNVSGHNRVWAQSCLGTIVSGHNRVWAQSCLGTIVSGHNRVGTIVWAQSCGLKYVWAQSCGLLKISQNNSTTLKLAKIIQIYKSKKYNFVINFRPISVLSELSKLNEKSVEGRAEAFISSNDILYLLQFCFRSGFDTSDAVLEFVDRFSTALDNKLHTIALFLDLSTVQYSTVLIQLIITLCKVN